MGSILQLSCKNCNCQDRFLLGAGLTDFQMEKAIARFDPDTVSQINTWVKNNKFDHYNLDIVLGFCKSCDKYAAIPTLEFFDKSKSVKKFYSRCLFCDAIPIITDYAQEKLLCRRCGNILENDRVGFWD